MLAKAKRIIVKSSFFVLAIATLLYLFDLRFNGFNLIRLSLIMFCFLLGYLTGIFTIYINIKRLNRSQPLYSNYYFFISLVGLAYFFLEHVRACIYGEMQQMPIMIYVTVGILYGSYFTEKRVNEKKKSQ